MSWSRGKRLLAVLAVTAALPLLASCSSFRPVYGDAGAASRYSFDYAAPSSRLDQIIYTELRLRLGPETVGPGTIKIAVSTSAGARALTRTAVTKPATSNEMVVTASISVIGANSEVVFTGSRTASAVYTTVGQVLADTAAQTEAAERAARALANTVRLTILGSLEARPGA